MRNTLIIAAAALLCLSSARGAAIKIADGGFHRYEWRANTFTYSSQEEPAVDVDAEGNFVVVWSSRRQQGGRYGIYAQRFTPRGVALGSETCVNLWTQSHQAMPSVAADARGGVWIAWRSHGQDAHRGAIIARRFDREFHGGSEIAVNQKTAGDQFNPVAAAAPNGRVLVLWTSAVGRNPARIRGRMFEADGRPRGDEFQVSEAKGRSESIASAAFTADGGFAVVFAVADKQHNPAGIVMQRFDADAKRLGGPINVCGSTKKSQIEPCIAAVGEGYVVCWLDARSDGGGYGVLARRFTAAGAPLGDPFVVNTQKQGTQNAAAIATAGKRRFAIVWNSADGNETGLFAQSFGLDGTRIGGAFRLNKHTVGLQEMRAAAGTRRAVFGRDGSLLAVWSGDAGLADKTSVNVSMLSPTEITLGNHEQGVTESMTPASIVIATAGGPEPHEPPTFDPKDIVALDDEGGVIAGHDFGFLAISNTGWTPPDPHMAVGPGHVVVMTNGAIAAFTKEGVKTFQEKIEGAGGFWGSVGATNFIFDPEVLYDELSGRFFAMAAEGRAAGRSFALIAVSDDSDPNGNWHKYRFETTALAGDLFDSPNIGVDRDVVYITGDGFGNGRNYPVFTLDKASMLAGDPIKTSRATTLPTSTQSAGIPPVSFDDPPALYMIEHQEFEVSTQVRLIALSDPLGAPTFTNFMLTVPAYRRPGRPVQKGTSAGPTTFDTRFWAAAYRNGSLWATHHINSNPVAARWYEIRMNGWPDSGKDPQLVQSGTINPGSGVHTYFTSITVDSDNTAAMTFARSSVDEFISMATTFRRATDPLGTMRPSVIQQTNVGPYTGSRWGDYSAVNVDPLQRGLFWAHHEFAINNSWRTWVAAFGPESGQGDVNCDGSLDLRDVEPFVLALLSPAEYEKQFPDCEIERADMNADGSVDLVDVGPFVEALIK